MTITLINVRVSNIRPEYDDLENWINDSNNIYIGRKGIVFIDGLRYPKEDSIFCNPFKIINDDRIECIKKYKVYIINKIKNENLQLELLKLKDKNLGCWCYPELCHGNVLIELINNFDNYF